MEMAQYLGHDIRKLLAVEPFSNWPAERSVEDQLDEPRIHYVFPNRGLALSCDPSGGVRTIFLFSDEYGGFDDSGFDLRFFYGRSEVLACLGTPTKSGEKSSDPIFGENGAWDRFSRPGFAIHVEYRPDADRISKITMMRSDIVP